MRKLGVRKAPLLSGEDPPQDRAPFGAGGVLDYGDPSYWAAHLVEWKRRRRKLADFLGKSALWNLCNMEALARVLQT